MHIKSHKVEVNRGPMSVVSTFVPLHVVPILKSIHGDMNVHVLDEVHDIDLDPQIEHGRLEKIFGVNTETNVNYVEEIYGQPFKGEIIKLMEDAAETPDMISVEKALDLDELLERDIDDMSIDTLKLELKSLGVKFHPSTGLIKLREKLISARMD